VLPIGGVKEKVLGAHRAGARHIILPKRNEADVDDVPADVRAELQFHFAETLDEVLAVALSGGAFSNPRVTPELASSANETSGGAASLRIAH
jgi:ATP-dependent Lon protease